MDFSTFIFFFWTGPFLAQEMFYGFFFFFFFFDIIYYHFKDIPVFNASIVNPDQTPLSAASDLGLHCSPVSLFLDSTLPMPFQIY